MSDESLLEFPCDFPIKVFGRNDEGFRDVVLSIMRAHFEDLSDDDVSERPSRADSFLSLTVVVRAESRAQIDAAYTDLSTHERVMMIL